MYRIITLFALIVLTATAASAQTFQAPTARPVVFTPPRPQALRFRPTAFRVTQPALNRSFTVVQFQNERFSAPRSATPAVAPTTFRPSFYSNGSSGGRQSVARNSLSTQSAARATTSRY